MMESDLFHLQLDVEKIDNSLRKHVLIMRIPDFMWLLNYQTNREIRTEMLQTHEDDNVEECQFQVMVKFVGRENELIEIYYKTHISVFVKPILRIFTSQNNNNTTVHFGQNNSNNRTGSYVTISEQPYQWVLNNEWQFMAMQYKSRLEDERKLCKNTMELRFEFLVCHSSNNLKREQPHLQLKEKEEFDELSCDLMTDRTSLLLNTAFSDVTVKSVEGDEFPAHKIFLITRSAVFKAHFDHNTVESKTNLIKSPFDTDVLKNVLSYIYTDDVPKINESPEKLLEAADFYQLNGLKKLCETALEKKLTVENAIGTLELANLHKAGCLKRKTLEFIKDGLAGDIIETEGWKKSQSAEVVKSVYECVVKNKLVQN